MLYHIFNVYPYYVINLALYLFAFEFILLIVMKCHIIWWWYIHILVYNFFSRRWLNVYNFVFQTGGWLVPRPFLRYFTVWISKGCPDQGKGGGGNPEPVRLSGCGWPKNWTQLLHAILDGVTSTILVTIRHHKMSSFI